MDSWRYGTEVLVEVDAMQDQNDLTARSATVIHLGAGRGKRLDEFRASGAVKIVLVEPMADAARALARQAAADPGVTLCHGALGKAPGEATLNCWNLAQMNSRREPTALLRDLFPGLRLQDRKPVPVLPPAQLVTDIGGIDRPACLILQDPGSEMEILQAWKADGLLDQIDRIELHAPAAVLYDGAVPCGDLEAWLIAEGFAVTARDDEDPDWPILHLRADHTARALARAETRIADLAQTLTERDTALKAAQEKIAEQETALAEARRARDDKAKALTERDAALKAAQDKIAEQETALGDRARTISALRDQVAQLTDQLQRDQYDQRRLAQDLGLSLRARDRLEADLQDLRQRHAQVLAVSQQQDALLRQLTPRLQRAAAELQMLSAGQEDAPPLPGPAPGVTAGRQTAKPKRSATGPRQGRKG